MFSKHKPKMVVLGLDGLPFSLSQILAKQGICPNLSTLAFSPNVSSIVAELPELSPVNWTSFFTANPPAKHGIFGFTRLNPSDYSLSVVNYSHVRSPTLFDHLTKHNLVTKTINLPNTYPAPKLNGICISGFIADDFDQAVYPPQLRPILQAQNYKLEADTTRGKEDHSFLFQELHQTLLSRQKALDLLWPDLHWDLFIVVLTETDRLFHFLYAAVEDTNHPFHLDALSFLKTWDICIGNILKRYEALAEPKRLIVLSDHGFTRLKTEVNLNVLLKDMGLLIFAKDPSDELDASCISSAAKAFALDPGRIYIHTDSFSRGTVTSGEKESLCRSIIQKVEALRYDNEPVLEKACFGNQIFAGPYTNEAPDILLVPKPGFDFKAKFNDVDLFSFKGRTGCHTWQDTFYYDSSGATIKSVHEAGLEVLKYLLPNLTHADTSSTQIATTP